MRLGLHHSNRRTRRHHHLQRHRVHRGLPAAPPAADPNQPQPTGSDYMSNFFNSDVGQSITGAPRRAAEGVVGSFGDIPSLVGGATEWGASWFRSPEEAKAEGEAAKNAADVISGTPSWLLRRGYNKVTGGDKPGEKFFSTEIHSHRIAGCCRRVAGDDAAVRAALRIADPGRP